MSDLPVWISTWLSRLEPHVLEIRPLAARTYIPQGSLFSRNADEIRRFIEANKRHHLFFGILGRDGAVGDKEHVRAAHCLWADIDFKELAGGKYLFDAQGKHVLDARASPRKIQIGVRQRRALRRTALSPPSITGRLSWSTAVEDTTFIGSSTSRPWTFRV